jgi:ATP-dependent DNA ligase I
MEYKKLVELYEFLEKTSSRLRKVEGIADFLWNSESEILPKVTLLIQGKVFPSYSEREIGVANKMMIKVISSATGFSENEVIKQFNETGDLGLTAEELMKRKKQYTLARKTLKVSNVFENVRKLALTEGKGSQDVKMNLVKELIIHSSPKEAKYIVRTVLEELRIGVAEGVIRDAIAKAYFSDIIWDPKRMIEVMKESKGKHFLIEKGLLNDLEKKFGKKIVDNFKKNNTFEEIGLEKIKADYLWKKKSKTDWVFFSNSKLGNHLKKEILDGIEWAWFLRPDYGEVAKIAKERGLDGLRQTKIELGKPFYVLLAEKAPSLEEALKAYENPEIEVKYDGMRVQIEKDNEKVWLFTRRQENVTDQFPDLVDLVKKCVKAKTCVLEGETLGIDPKTDEPLPFQALSQRIHRKYDIHKTAKEIPIQVNLFDIVYLDGKQLFNVPFRERRRILESVVKPIPGKFQLAEQLITKDLKKAKEFYQKALKAKQEGVMVKNLDALYQPGKRVAGGWLKVKPIMETLDLVITGAQWGTGKRAGWFGSFVLACRDEETGEFLECGMMGTGVKEKKTNEGDVTFKDLTEMLKPYVEIEKGNEVKIKPKITVEIAYEEIQKSPNYRSGYALRFPRLIRLRTMDKSPEQADTLERVKNLYEIQKGKGKNAKNERKL